MTYPRVKPAGASASAWHVSPWVDMLGYHWSWAPPLAILLLLGDSFRVDDHVMALAAWGLNFAHQAVTLPLVYLDGGVFRSERRRLTVGPLALLLLFVATVLLWHTTIPQASLDAWELAVVPALVLLLVQVDAVLRDDRALPWRRLWLVGGLCVAAALCAVLSGSALPIAPGPLLLGGVALTSGAIAFAARRRRSAGELVTRARRAREEGIALALAIVAIGAACAPADPVWPAAPLHARELVIPIYAVAYAWNFWHIYMQKYGILRLYAAKSGAPLDRRTPGWVDRLLVFAWIPLLVAIVVPAHAEVVYRLYGELRPIAGPFVAPLVTHARWFVSLGVGLVLFSAAAFLRYEHRASGLESAPRASAAAAFTVLSAAFLVVDPIKVALAFGLSHTFEYFVFVWAWQRRKYAVPEPRPSLMGRLMRRPALAVYGFMIVAAFFWYAGDAWGRDWGRGFVPRPLGLTPMQWLTALAPYLAMSHFYVDGFLWKMRKPSVRANI